MKYIKTLYLKNNGSGCIRNIKWHDDEDYERLSNETGLDKEDLKYIDENTHEQVKRIKIPDEARMVKIQDKDGKGVVVSLSRIPTLKKGYVNLFRGYVRKINFLDTNGYPVNRVLVLPKKIV